MDATFASTKQDHQNLVKAAKVDNALADLIAIAISLAAAAAVIASAETVAVVLEITASK